MSKAKPIPDGFNTVSTYLIVKNASKALEFYSKAFGAEPGVRMAGPDGESTMHAEMRMGNSTVMLTEENPQWGSQSPETLGGSPSSLHVYVEDADALFKRAIEAGCEVRFPIADTFWGDRYGKLKDPFGHEWGIATHQEDVGPEEMAKRAEEFFASMAAGGECEEGK
jgi:PhnB protein